MSFESAVLTREVATSIRQERSNVFRLAIAQALAGANSTVVCAAGAVVGDMLAPSKSLATLPVSIFVVGMALSTLPAGAIAQRQGRRMAFMLGTGCGVLAGILATLAVCLRFLHSLGGLHKVGRRAEHRHAGRLLI